MKSVFVKTSLFVLFFAGGSAMACPQISGNYRCTAMMGLFSMNVPVTQSESDRITTYVIDGAPVIADGRKHHADTLPAMLARFVSNVDYTASCSGETVSFDGTGNMNRTREDATVKGTLRKVNDRSVTINMSFTSPRKNQNVTANCTKF